ncbi:MAG: NAD(P)/FAD-dependent oxidoreductase [Acidimicrobiia bacterium]|nr:NAD(P)/FAD-dependent oxidoreductase [Acidimicrobiia bacterium]
MLGYDAVVVGAGPNGLAAAAHLTRSGKRVLVVEQADEIGGGTQTAELTLPGFLHDVCSAIHPLGIASPFFRGIGLDVDWIQPEIPVSHPLGGGRGAGLFRNLDESAARFGGDADHYRRVVGPLIERADRVIDDFLGPLRVPRHPGSFVRLASRGLLPASRIISGFTNEEARAVFAGMAAHAIAPLSSPLTGGVALLFATTAHAYGWPMVKGGSQGIAAALAAVIVGGGGSIETGHMVRTLDEFGDGSVFLLDVMPDAAVRMAGDRVGSGALRGWTGRQSGQAVFKVDWALDGPIPWSDEISPRAGTVHVGGTFAEVMASEDDVHSGRHPERPFVLLAQHTPFDPTRAPEGKHTAWGYCHVPRGSNRDMTVVIESQVERFAPGFRDLILARHTMNASDLESHNPNYAAGDIAGGRFGLRKLFQPGSRRPYKMGQGVYLCSSATPPGAGVHGMCGYYAAEAALAAMG